MVDAYITDSGHFVKAQQSNTFEPVGKNRQLSGHTGDAGNSPESPTIDLNAKLKRFANTEDYGSLLLFQQALNQAHLRSASHVYIEPEESITRIRFRVASKLQEQLFDNSRYGFSVRTILRLLTDSSVDEQNIGIAVNLLTKLEKQDYEIQLLPLFGRSRSSLTIRLRKKLRLAPTLDELGIPKSLLRHLRELIRSETGTFLINGPLDSGKKLSLYALLQELNSPERKIISIEKDIRCQIPRISQIEFPASEPDQSYFGNFLLRQSADAIFIDDLGDASLTSTLIRAALTNNALFAATYAQSAVSGIQQLLSLEISPLLLGHALKAILTQQQLPLVCSHCKTIDKISDEEKAWISNNFPGKSFSEGCFTKGEGCDQCVDTGLSGQVRIYELVRIDAEMTDAIVRGDIGAFTTAIALRDNFYTLKQSAFNLACQGKIPLKKAMTIH